MGRPVSKTFALMLSQKGKEILTDNNIPQGQCVICLYGFQVGMCLLTPQTDWEVRQENRKSDTGISAWVQDTPEQPPAHSLHRALPSAIHTALPINF